jgi:hypothetical protein
VVQDEGKGQLNPCKFVMTKNSRGFIVSMNCTALRTLMRFLRYLAGTTGFLLLWPIATLVIVEVLDSLFFVRGDPIKVHALQDWRNWMGLGLGFLMATWALQKIVEPSKSEDESDVTLP